MRVQKFFEKPSLTRQEFQNECDLEKQVRRFAQTPDGAIALRNAQGFQENLQFGDVSEVPDYRTARDMVLNANERFMQLPASLRKKFDNDAANFLDYCSNPDNLDEMRKLGLAKPLAPVEEPAQLPS